jgi:hypothetical protein
MSSHVRKWDTSDELMYLDQIGQCHASTQKISPAIMLKAYLQSAEKRVQWGSIERGKVVSYARRLLKDCARGAV